MIARRPSDAALAEMRMLVSIPFAEMRAERGRDMFHSTTISGGGT